MKMKVKSKYGVRRLIFNPPLLMFDPIGYGCNSELRINNGGRRKLPLPPNSVISDHRSSSPRLEPNDSFIAHVIHVTWGW